MKGSAIVPTAPPHPTIPKGYSGPFIARVTARMRGDVTAGVLLVIAAALGIALANSPLSEWYLWLRDVRLGPDSLGLHLTIGQWASDGLLAIFFFLVGLELKREFVAGDLRNPRTAMVPVAAAFGGVAVPALIYFIINRGTAGAQGWAIPTATDIAFAVAVLGLVAPRIPTILRVFLLTLAVVDDLVAIGIIAIFYTDEVQLLPLALAIVPFALYGLLAQRFGAWFKRASIAPWLILLPLGALVWALMHASGIHATVAGVLLAFTVPVQGLRGEGTAQSFEHRFRPLSTVIAVPVFAFFAAGVSLSGDHLFPASTISIGILAGLVLGKPVGIVLMALVTSKLTGASFGASVSMRDLIGVGCLAGTGFTVSLLVTELSFDDPLMQNTGRLAVIAASLISIVLAAVLLARKRERLGTQVLSRV